MNIDQGFGTGSNVTFGSVPDDCIHGGSENVNTLYLDKKYDDWWTVRMRDLRYGKDSIKSSNTFEAILDSGTSFMSISKSDFDNLA